jgi:hypothetical protein
VRKNLVRNGLIAASVMNIGGVLLFSRAFTNDAISEADPIVMSNFGLLMIAVWGLAYLGAATASTSIKWLAGAFAIEKAVYVVAWLLWLSKNNLVALYSRDVFAGVFFSVYGLNDLVFMLFFVWIFFSAQAEKREARR